MMFGFSAAVAIPAKTERTAMMDLIMASTKSRRRLFARNQSTAIAPNALPPPRLSPDQNPPPRKVGSPSSALPELEQNQSPPKVTESNSAPRREKQIAPHMLAEPEKPLTSCQTVEMATPRGFSRSSQKVWTRSTQLRCGGVDHPRRTFQHRLHQEIAAASAPP